MLKLEDVYRQPAKHLLRAPKERSNFAALGAEIWDRAEQDAKIRHKHNGAGMNRRDLLCSLLDIRTKDAGHLSQAEYDEARVVLKADYMQYAMKVERQTREVMRGAPVAVAATPEAAAPEAAAPEAQGAEPAARWKRPRNGERPRSGFVVKRNRFVEAVANVNEASQSEETQWEEAIFLHH